MKEIYGMIEASLLWYIKFKKDLELVGFNFNVYDGCVATRMVKKLQHTIIFNVGGVLSSHVD